MINQNTVREKIQVLRGEIKQLIDKIQHKNDYKDQADGVIDSDAYSDRSDIHEYTPDSDETLSSRRQRGVPRDGVILSDGSSDGQDLVWDRETVRSSKIEDVEDVEDEEDKYEPNLDIEDDLGSGQWQRYN